ncbi:MAG: DNA mismatch repair protein MutS [Chlamydiae bacterium]|nr:DNA mismatch repair protein MutS [Chlamydiota bacterium]
MDNYSSSTPMMQQWKACKESAKESLLLFRLGDFYEGFYEDAKILSEQLELALTKRQDVPMAGVPAHMIDHYVDKLTAKGFSVAIAEQIESQEKGLMQRKIMRVITPGTTTSPTLLHEKNNNYLACIVKVNGIFGLALLDITTAEFRVQELDDWKEVIDELSKFVPKEILCSEDWKIEKELIKEMKEIYKPKIQFKEKWVFDHRTALEFLLGHFHLITLDGFGLKGMVGAINAAGSLLSHVKNELFINIDHITKISLDKQGEFMSLDLCTQRNLELTRPLHEGQKESTLLHLLDKTLTPMGGRLLKHWTIHPLLSIEEIEKRQQAISQINQNFSILQPLFSHFEKIRDLERLLMRIEMNLASPRDFLSLSTSLEQIPFISKTFGQLHSPFIQNEVELLSDPSEITEKIAKTILPNPSLKPGDGNVIQNGIHAELDSLRSLKKDNHEWIAKYQTELKALTGIKTLKIGYTKAFGYYIETSRSASEKVPPTFQKKQTLVNTDRFTTAELKEFEYKILTAEEKIANFEITIFQNLRKEISTHALLIRQIAAAIAKMDCILSLAKVAKSHQYICPVIDESDLFIIKEGRHPVIEVFMEETFIANDIEFNESQRMHLITGPNMAGKSTYIRQAALLAIMAQIGSFIPAKFAHIGIIDQVLSRIGASDDLIRGQSTFMVEMVETANILNKVTRRSLVILDEIGRGTSTFDGISIAWAVAEFLLHKDPKTLFATHYFELTEMEKNFPNLINLNVAIEETDKEITFLRKVKKGKADKSYGIHVARLAGLPSSVITKAKEKLKELEGKTKSKLKFSPNQLEFFSSPQKESSIEKEIKTLDLDQMTPLEALQKIHEWKNQL